MKKFAIILALATSALAGCTRIESGTVGLRVDMSKQVAKEELKEGSWNQTIVGDVLTFHVRSIQVGWDNLRPQTKDNSTLKELDVSLVYDIAPTAVSDIWVKQSRSFHTNEHGEIVLMKNYVNSLLATAASKAVREHNALDVADKRTQIETDTMENVRAKLKEEGLETAIHISQVRVTAVTPADDIVASANAAVRARNDLVTKQVEVEIAKQEAIRIQTLNSNSQAIPYMNAMANMEIAKAVREGRVNTIVIPSDFKGIVNVK